MSVACLHELLSLAKSLANSKSNTLKDIVSAFSWRLLRPLTLPRDTFAKRLNCKVSILYSAVYECDEMFLM